MSDKQRVLAFLHQAGPHGITQWDLHRPPDNGKPIERAAARVLDLRNDGETIVTRPERVGKSRIARYIHGDYVGKQVPIRVEPDGQMALVEGRAA